MRNPAAQIRLYAPRDEGEVRRICFETALFGRPIAAWLDDPQLVAEALIGCHIRCETETVYVAEADGRVVGYLAGRLDSRHPPWRCVCRMLWLIPWLWTRHGHWRRPRSWRLAWAAARYGRTVLRLSAGIAARYPANLHVNIDPGCRRTGAGRALVGRFLQEAARRGCPGVHLLTPSADGKAFFARLGFETVRRAAAPLVPGHPPREIWVMVKAVGRQPSSPVS